MSLSCPLQANPKSVPSPQKKTNYILQMQIPNQELRNNSQSSLCAPNQKSALFDLTVSGVQRDTLHKGQHWSSVVIGIFHLSGGLNGKRQNCRSTRQHERAPRIARTSHAISQPNLGVRAVIPLVGLGWSRNSDSSPSPGPARAGEWLGNGNEPKSPARAWTRPTLQ